jgi:hypothetical protein
MELSDFQDKFRDSVDESLLEDWTAQIHRNAQIALDKHSWARVGANWSFFGSLFWLAAIVIYAKG